MNQTAAGLGKAGIAFLIALALFFVFYFAGLTGLMVLDILVLIPLMFFLLPRASRFFIRHSLWSLNNRLICVYGLFGVVPVLLLFVLFGLTTWSFMSELAVYLAQSALNRELGGTEEAVKTVLRYPPKERQAALKEIYRAYAVYYPQIAFYVTDQTGTYQCPKDAPVFEVPSKWGDAHGLLLRKRSFYGWAHYVDAGQQITVVTPLTNAMVSNLVPKLGGISLVDYDDPNSYGATIGSLAEDVNPLESVGPKPVSRLDLPIAIAASQLHNHLHAPNVQQPLILWVHSRPSAVLRTFFSQADMLRGVLADVVIGVAVLFFFVEIAALVLGVSLSRRITRAVNQLYEGTQQVISGDFGHRIPVTSRDQLGDLASSFNQMTAHLERLLVSEKERERLQAEIAIAREVQSQLYPREEPPKCGVRLTARCDPARMVSGDYYDYQLIGQSKLAFAVGDVAGKGISAALLMATIQSSLRAQLSEKLPTAESECTLQPEVDSAALVRKLSKQIYEHTSPEKYATFFFGLYDEAMRTLTYTNAGHLPPLLFRNDEVTALDINGMVIGILPGSTYNESCIAMGPGDLLVCYTDGITEPENEYGEMFGEERLIELVKKHRCADDHEIIRIVFDAVRNWTGAPELHDDMTLLLARQVGAS